MNVVIITSPPRESHAAAGLSAAGLSVAGLSAAAPASRPSGPNLSHSGDGCLNRHRRR
jgi:hypothetical protein